MKILVLDLDGTVVDTTKRFEMCLREVNANSLAELKGKQRSAFWNCFQSPKYMNLDEPKQNVTEFVRKVKAKGYLVHIVSGRSEGQLEATLEQLNKYNVPYDKITVRRPNDFRKDFEFKGEIISTYINEGHEVIIVDDSPDVRALLPEKAYDPNNLPDPEKL